MNTWEMMVVLVSALALMPFAAKASLYSLMASALLSRVMTLSLILGSAALVYAKMDAGVATGVALFSINMVRRNGGAGALTYSIVAPAMGAAVVYLAFFSGSYVASANGLVWFAVGIACVKGALYVTASDSLVNRVNAVLRVLLVAVMGGAAYYANVLIPFVADSLLPQWNLSGVFIWASVFAIFAIGLRTHIQKEVEEDTDKPGESGETTAISCFELEYYYGPDH